MTGVAPSKLIFRYPVKTKIPSLPEEDREDIRVKDWVNKKKGKEYADKSRNAKYSPVQVGDQVLVQQPKENKLSSTFETKPYEVTERTGNEVVLNGTYRRNVKHVKNFQTDDTYQAEEPEDYEGAESNVPSDAKSDSVPDGGNLMIPVDTTTGGDHTRPIRPHKIPSRFKDFVLM